MGLLGSGFISFRLTHRDTIVLSSMAVGVALLAVSLSESLWATRLGLVALGVAAGLYLPSGIATITALVGSRDWGKAVGIHELAPNMSYLSAPLLVELLMTWFSWRGIIAVLGAASVGVGLIFMRFGRGGTFHGATPSPGTLQVLFVKPSLWIMMMLFSMGIGGTLGVYAMLPLYLVAERGIERGLANTLVALSRIPAPGAALLGGWVSDRLGRKQALMGVFLATGIATVLLGTVPGLWVIPVLFVQCLFAVCFFPAGFSALSSISAPEVRNVAVSLAIPVAYVVGGGAVPTGIGVMGEHYFFSWGIMGFGGLLLVGIVLLRYLTYYEDTRANT